MTASVEDRIVAMKIENTQFEKGVTQSLGSLQKLEAALNKGMSGKGLTDVQNSIGRFNFNPIHSGLDQVSKGFLAMSTIAITALAQVTSTVISTGTNLVKSLSLDPIMGGFSEYSTTLNSIQTVLANTEAQGTTLTDVNKSLDQLNDYSDKTIYNFGEMAKNIGTFTAAGVSLEGSVESIKGIANLAALSGSSSEQASTAMYQLSQAIASGRVSLQDWNSVVNAGMGGSTFQKALATTAQAMGTIDASAVKIDKSTGKMTINGASFRDSISAIGGEKWLTSDVLTKTLSQFTGDLTDAELAAQGFNKAEIAAIQQTAKTAQDAATKVKTIQQVFDVAKETIGSGWAQTFRNIFGDFEEARTTFTSLSNTINGFINTNADARNKVLKDWAALGGRTKIISAVTNAWKALMSVLGPIKDAFREIFPAKTGKDLKDISKALNEFFRHLRLTKDAQEDLKNTFAGFFAVLHIGFTIVSGIAHVIGTLLGLFIHGQGSTLAFTGSIGEMLVALDAFLTHGKFVENFFNLLANAITAVVGPIFQIKNALIDAFVGLITGDPSRFFDGISDSITFLLNLVNSLSDGFANVVNSISDSMGGLGHISGFDLGSMFGGASAKDAVKGIANAEGALFGLSETSTKIAHIWDAVVNAFHAVGNFIQPLTDQFSRAFGALKEQIGNLFSGHEVDFTDFLAAINTGLFLGIYLSFRKFAGAISGIGKSAQGVLSQVTSNLKTMQNEVRADMIFKIAASLALLAGAVFLLAQTDPQSLGLALGAVVVMLTALVIALKTLEKSVGKMKDAAKLSIVAAAFTILAVGLAAMAGAVYLFGLMDTDTLAKGLAGVTASLIVLTAAAALLTKSGAGANMVGASVGLLIMSVALSALSAAILLYSRIDPQTLTNGLVKVAATIAVLALSMNLMRTGIGGAAAMVIVAGALVVLAGVLKLISKISGGDIVKGLATIGAALLILAGGLYLMQGTLAGAAAVFIAAEALLILGPAIAFFGQMDWGTIGKGLAVIVGSMLALAAVSYVIGPVVPVLLGLAAAVALIGGAVFLAGAGVALFATGLAVLTKSGTEGFAIFKLIVMDFINFLPEVILGLGDTIDAMATLIGDKGPQLIEAFTAILSALIDAGIKLAPKFGKLVSVLIKTFLKVLVTYYSDLARAGLELITNLLDAIGDAVPGIVEKAADIAIAFVKAMAKQGVKFADAAFTAIIDFMNGLADVIRERRGELAAAGANIAGAVIGGITGSIRDAYNAVKEAILSMLRSAAAAAKDGAKGIVNAVLPGSPLRGDMVALMINRLGLVGGTEEIKEAFAKINATFTEQLDKTNKIIKEDKAKLEKLNKAGKGGSKEAQKLKDELREQNKLRKQLTKEQKIWNKKMKDERETLLGLGKQYDTLMGKISDAQAALDDITKKRDDIASKFNSTPDITSGMSLNSYLRQIQKKTEQTAKFMATLQQLRALGLSDQAYQQLLNEGTDAQHLMEQMLAGGQTAVLNFNSVNAQMQAGALQLANEAAQQLYGTGVAAAQGLVDGLNAQIPALEAVMAKIARKIVKAMEHALQINSPSRVFANRVGRFIPMGVAVGMIGSIGVVENAAEQVGTAALETLRATMNRASDMVNMDFNPVISPVLDLTQLQKEATKISSMLTTNPIVAGVSYETASNISTDRQAAAEAALAVKAQPSVTEVSLVQNNTSPKALDDIEIYRSTNNQLSLMKEVLGIT